jgi:endonuclease YncB( thermonuclease family)
MTAARPLRLAPALTPVLALLAGLFVVLGPAPSASAADKDCSDFATQKAAQIFFLKNGGPSRDPHRLDAEGDGIACESNSCTCYYKKTLPKGSASTAPRQIRQRGKVTKVVDGDTVDVRLSTGGVKRIRMIGIDTPEVYGRVECGGPAASRSLKRMLPVGTRVRLLSDTSQDRRDRYGRLLRYVIKISTGNDMNRQQVSRGQARVYVYHHNPFHRVAKYRASQRAARAHDRGLWGHC